MRHHAHWTAFVALGGLALAGAARAASVTRGPYLQTPTPASVVVRWRTDVATDSRVRFGAAPGSLGSTADDATVTTEHVVTVSGLGAATTYYYSVGSVGGAFVGDDSDHWFRTAPAPGSSVPMRIWVTGDGGFANANGEAVRDAYAAYNGDPTADLWLLLGDNAYLLGTDANYQAALFDMHHDMLRTTPAWPVFGNHEAFSSNSLTQTGPFFDMFSLPTDAAAGGAPSGSETYFSFDYGNVHFVVLDSEANAPTSASGPMLTWLETDLQGTTADWIVAMWHRPPYSRGLFHDSDVETNEINMRQYVLPILEDYGVDLVLCGHSHNYERSYLLDGHYGPSGTFDLGTHAVDAGDGDPAGDGAYRKPMLGASSHRGAVYVVAGSSSEVRPATLDHPALPVGLLELGSVVLDVDGNTLTAQFLNSAAAVTDTFRIVKGCAPTAATGCVAGAKGKLVVKNNADDAKDKVVWKWSGGTLDAAQVGTPQADTDLGLCVYDQSGLLAGGALPRGALWVPRGTGLQYADKAVATLGIQKMKLKPGAAPKTLILAKGKGAGLGLPGTVPPATTPLTAQLVNLDTGACWQSVFTSTRKNANGTIVATMP